MTWTPNSTLKIAVDAAAEIVLAAEACGIPFRGRLVDTMLFQHRVIDIINDMLGGAAFASMKEDNKRAAAEGRLPEGWGIRTDGLIHAGPAPKKPPEIMLWSDGTFIDPLIWQAAEIHVGPGSIESNAADIHAHAMKVKAEYDRLMNAKFPDPNKRPENYPWPARYTPEEIEALKKEALTESAAFPSAKDNLREPVDEAEEAKARAWNQAFAKKLAEDVAPKPGGIIETHVGTAWGEGPQAGLFSSDQHIPPINAAQETITSVEAAALMAMDGKPLGNGSGASVDADTQVAQSQIPAKKKGRPKGSYGKKKREAMKKAKAAERAAAKAEKEVVAVSFPTLEPDPGEGAAPVVTMDVNEIEAPTTVEVKDFVEKVSPEQ